MTPVETAVLAGEVWNEIKPYLNKGHKRRIARQLVYLFEDAGANLQGNEGWALFQDSFLVCSCEGKDCIHGKGK